MLSSVKRCWKITLLVVLLLPLLLHLGYWQLQRAEEKQQLLAVYQQQRDLPAIPLSELDDGELANYRSVVIRGRYDTERYWFLDNRSRQQQAGYEVVMPLLTTEGVVLINRGWVAAPLLRSELPSFDTPAGDVWVRGYLYPAATNAIVQHSDSDLARDWPRRVLHLPTSAAKSALNRDDVYPLWVRIDEEAPGALLTQWVLTAVKPQKHRGYAVQWFAMALALVVLYGWCIFRENGKH